MGPTHEVDRPWVDHDELRALAQPALHVRRKYRVRVRRVGADDDHDIGVIYRVEVLGAGGLSERRLEAVAGGRVADPRAGIDIVVAERSAHQLLDQVRLLVRAPGRRDAADRTPAILRLDALELRRGVRDRLLP